MPDLPGTPSDELPDVRAAGGTDVTTIVVSMSARHPEGRDAEYLEWHALDHAPEQYRLAALRGALRLVSTPRCRAARAVSTARYDAVDHVMTYLFADRSALAPFQALGAALFAGGRMPMRLPPVELGVFGLAGTAAAARAVAGAEVIPWRPARGAYLLVEEGGMPADDLTDVPGVAGVWWYSGTTAEPLSDVDTTGLQLTCCYLDDDPVEVAGGLRAAAEKRWAGGGVVPLLAAPFHTVVPFEWGGRVP